MTLFQLINFLAFLKQTGYLVKTKLALTVYITNNVMYIEVFLKQLTAAVTDNQMNKVRLHFVKGDDQQKTHNSRQSFKDKYKRNCKREKNERTIFFKERFNGILKINSGKKKNEGFYTDHIYIYIYIYIYIAGYTYNVPNIRKIESLYTSKLEHCRDTVNAIW